MLHSRGPPTDKSLYLQCRARRGPGARTIRVETEPGLHTLHADPAGEACWAFCPWHCRPVRFLHSAARGRQPGRASSKAA